MKEGAAERNSIEFTGIPKSTPRRLLFLFCCFHVKCEVNEWIDSMLWCRIELKVFRLRYANCVHQQSCVWGYALQFTSNTLECQIVNGVNKISNQVWSDRLASMSPSPNILYLHIFLCRIISEFALEIYMHRHCQYIRIIGFEWKWHTISKCLAILSLFKERKHCYHEFYLIYNCC